MPQPRQGGRHMLNAFLYGYPGYIIGPAIVGLCVLTGLLGQLAAFRLLPAPLRLENKDATVYMASIVGVIYAVLLAFIAVSDGENFNRANSAGRRFGQECVRRCRLRWLP